MEDKYLIEKKESFFSRIKNWFNSIFTKNKILEEEKTDSEIKENEIENINDIAEIKENDTKNKDSDFKIKYQEDKAKFMDIYNKVKKKEIEVNSLDEETVKKISKLLYEEILMKVDIIKRDISM